MKYLNLSTKIQFYKSFILPHFDYCLGLCVFYTKQQIDNLEKFFNISLFNLFNFNLFNLSIENQKSFLDKFGLLPFKLRFFTRLSILFYKIINNSYLNSFYNALIFKDPLFFRNRELVEIPNIRSEYGRTTISYVFPKFVFKKFIVYNLPFSMLKESFFCEFIGDF